MSATLRAAATRFEALEPNLNRLDAATGDGDHGATMVKGCAPQQRRPGTRYGLSQGSRRCFGHAVRAGNRRLGSDRRWRPCGAVSAEGGAADLYAGTGQGWRQNHARCAAPASTCQPSPRRLQRLKPVARRRRRWRPDADARNTSKGQVSVTSMPAPRRLLNC